MVKRKSTKGQTTINIAEAGVKTPKIKSNHSTTY
jgi:hypothetical protein